MSNLVLEPIINLKSSTNRPERAGSPPGLGYADHVLLKSMRLPFDSLGGRTLVAAVTADGELPRKLQPRDRGHDGMDDTRESNSRMSRHSALSWLSFAGTKRNAIAVKERNLARK
jgi:hypothetical protein